MSSVDGQQKAPKTSGKVFFINKRNNSKMLLKKIGYLMLGSILSFISLMLLMMSYAR